jgi:hypothetical protein
MEAGRDAKHLSLQTSRCCALGAFTSHVPAPGRSAQREQVSHFEERTMGMLRLYCATCLRERHFRVRTRKLLHSYENSSQK